jgi:hypothetical protein
MTDTLYSVFQNYREKINFPHQYKRETIIKGFFYASVWFYRGLNYYKSGNIAHSYDNPIIPKKKTSNRQNCWNKELKKKNVHYIFWNIQNAVSKLDPAHIVLFFF